MTFRNITSMWYSHPPSLPAGDIAPQTKANVEVTEMSCTAGCHESMISTSWMCCPLETREVLGSNGKYNIVWLGN